MTWLRSVSLVDLVSNGCCDVSALHKRLSLLIFRARHGKMLQFDVTAQSGVYDYLTFPITGCRFRRIYRPVLRWKVRAFHTSESQFWKKRDSSQQRNRYSAWVHFKSAITSARLDGCQIQMSKESHELTEYFDGSNQIRPWATTVTLLNNALWRHYKYLPSRAPMGKVRHMGKLAPKVTEVAYLWSKSKQGL